MTSGARRWRLGFRETKINQLGDELKAFRAVLLTGFVAATMLAMATPASATTFCVPGFFAACPDNGTNVATADLSQAMSDNGNDGKADRVIIAAGTVTQPGNERIEASGLDPLEVTGAGREQTVIRSTVSGNNFVALLNDRPGITLADLTIAGSAALGAGLGAIAQIKDATMTNVGVQVNNQGADGLTMIGDNTLTGVRVVASEGSSLDYGIRLNGSSPGHSVVTGSIIERPSYGLQAVANNVSVEFRNSWIEEPQQAAVWVGKGAEATIRNSVISTSGMSAFVVQPEAGTPKESLLRVDSSTIFSSGPVPGSDPAIDVNVPNASAGDATINVSSSIIRGFEHTWDMSVPAGPGIGKAFLNITHSNFVPGAPASSSGNPNVDDPSNVNADPLFAGPGNFRLSPGSPSIDSGDPASLLTVDHALDPRPVDGDLNGSALPDQGAFEFQPTCATVPSICPDETAPKVTRVKFRSKARKSSSLSFRVSEAAKVRLVFRPLGRPAKGRKGKKRRVVKITRNAKAGQVRLRISKRRLKPGRYRLKITAIDLAGNSSKLSRNVNVQQIRVEAKSDS